MSLWVAFGLRYEFRIPPAVTPIPDNMPVLPGDVGVPESVWHTFFGLLIFVVFVKAVVFGYFRLYAGWWQYVSIQDLIETFKASHISTFIILARVYTCRLLFKAGAVAHAVAGARHGADHRLGGHDRPGRGPAGSWCGSSAKGSRPVSPAGLTRVLIVGAGDVGEGVLRELYRLPVERYHVVGFVDDDPNKRGIRIHGVPVLGGVDDLAAVAERQNAQEVIIALAQPKRDELRRIIEICKGRKLTFRIVPGVADLIEGRIDVSRLREVDINDLLGRDPVTLDLESIGQFLAGKVVLVTGAGGSIGSELCRQVIDLQAQPPRPAGAGREQPLLHRPRVAPGQPGPGPRAGHRRRLRPTAPGARSSSSTGPPSCSMRPPTNTCR